MPVYRNGCCIASEDDLKRTSVDDRGLRMMRIMIMRRKPAVKMIKIKVYVGIGLRRRRRMMMVMMVMMKMRQMLSVKTAVKRRLIESDS